MQKKYETDPDFKHYDNYDWEKLVYGEQDYEEAREEDRNPPFISNNDKLQEHLANKEFDYMYDGASIDSQYTFNSDGTVTYTYGDYVIKED